MAKRIEIIGKSLVVTDTVSSAVLLDVPKSDYYYNIKRLVDNGLIVFYNLDFKDNLKSSPDPIYLSEAVDSTDTAFDEAGFIAFCRANLGFRFGEGDVTVNPLTLYPVENEYADINSVSQLLDDQVNQTENFFQYVIDATDDGRVTSVDGDAYYQKLSTSTGSLADYRLLTDSEVLVLQNSNSWRIFRISAINNDSTPLTTVPNTRVGVDYNVGTDYVTAFLFDRFFSDTIENISTASNMSIQVYNQNTDIIYLATIDSFDIVGQYLRANVTSTIDKDSWAVNQRLEFVFDSSGGSGTGLSTITADTGTVISLANATGNYCNMGSANATTTYTTTGAVDGGWALVFVNAASEPVITGATKEHSNVFYASTDMYMRVYYDGTTVKYSFLRKDVLNNADNLQKDVTDNYTVTSADNGYLIKLSNATAKTITVNNDLSDNFECTFWNKGAGTFQFAAGTATIVTPEGTYLAASKACYMFKDGSANSHIITGNLATS